MKALKFSFLFVLLSPLFLSAQSFSFLEDFQSTTAGSRPSSGVYTQGGVNGIIQVVDDEGANTDPFGPAGNHSLMIWDNNTGIPRASWTHGSAGIPLMTQGAISFDFYFDDREGAGNMGVFFFLGESGGLNPNTNQRAFNININNSGTVRVQNGTATYQSTVNYTITRETAYNFQIVFEDKEYAVFVKSAAEESYTKLYYGDNIDSFSYSNPLFNVDFIQFTTGDGNNSFQPVYIDNLSITVIPEGSYAAGLMGGVFLGLGLYFRRKNRSL